MASVAIRPARFPHDAAAVTSLIGSYLRQTEEEKAERGLAPADAPLPDRYAREIDDPAAVFADRRVLLASVDDVACGVVVIASSATDTEISRLWTVPQARGRGVGSALLDAALDGAVRPVRLSVWEWREPAIRLYRAAGFVAVPSWDDRPGLMCLELRRGVRITGSPSLRGSGRWSARPGIRPRPRRRRRATPTPTRRAGRR